MAGAAEVGLATLDDLIGAFPGRGDDPAIVTFGAGDEMSILSYARLHADLARFASGLRDRGFGSGGLALLWAPNGPPWITAYLGIVAAGGTVIPLDDQADLEGLQVVLAKSSPACVVTVTGHLEALREAGIPEVIPFLLLDPDENGQCWWQRGRADVFATRMAVDEGGVAALLYTSGTTGTPKGVPLTHANLMSNVRALLAAGIVSRRDRVLLPLPLHHAYPATVGMLTVFACGAAIVLPAGVTGPELAAAANRAGATILVGVPRLYEALLESVWAGIHARGRAAGAWLGFALRVAGAFRRGLGINIGRLAFRSVHRRLGRSLRILASGGARLDPAVARQLEAMGWLVLTGYGLTETSPVVTFNLPGEQRLDTQGRVLGGVELRIADATAEGHGEIQVRGPNVFPGYWHDARATGRAFAEDGWFRTGDAGFLDGDGFLQVLGRESEVIVLSDGKKISPEALERRYERSPYIREVGLLAPEGDLLALVVPDEDAVRGRGAMSERSLLRDELDTVMSALPSWQRVREYRLVRRSLPRTRLGKLRRHLLPAVYAQASSSRPPSANVQIGEDDRRLLESAPVEPVWRWLTERYPGVTLDSSPQLDLGIDSLGWVSLTAGLEDRFGTSLRGEQLSRVLTIRDLLRAVDAAARAGPRGTGSDDRTGEAARYLEVPGLALRSLGMLIIALVRFVMTGPYRLRVSGLEHLPRGRPFLVAPNHSSYLDPLAVAAALPPAIRRRTCWAGWAGKMHRGRAWRTVSRALRVFPVDPDQDLGQAIRLAARVLEAGDVLVWFPEGRRSRDGALQPLRRGIGVLAGQVPVPVVPARIDGTYAAWPAQHRWPRFGRVSIRFGRAESPDTLARDGDGDDDAARISNALARRIADL